MASTTTTPISRPPTPIPDLSRSVILDVEEEKEEEKEEDSATPTPTPTLLPSSPSSTTTTFLSDEERAELVAAPQTYLVTQIMRKTSTSPRPLPKQLPAGDAFDETDELALYFDATINGDIYCKKSNELVCTSGPQHIVVRGIANIHENVVETYPCFDGTLIRAFHHNGKWKLATRKKINAFNSHWSQSQSFGELFEEIAKVKVDYLDYSLKEDFAYTFLLLSPKVTNVLFNVVAELLFVSAFDRKRQVWEQTTGESFPTIVCQRPPFAKRVVKSDSLPKFDPDLKAPKTPAEKLKMENMLLEKSFKDPVRNQRGLLFIGKSGRLYRQDYQKYRNWQRIICERPLHIVWFEQMKKSVKRDPSCVLSEFYQHYPTFSMKGVLFEMCVRVLRFEFFSNGGLPKPLPDHLQTMFLAVRERNKLTVPSYEFIRRTIAFQKYAFLVELMFGEEGQPTREFVNVHRNRYTEVERHVPSNAAVASSTQYVAPTDSDLDTDPDPYGYDGNGTSPPPVGTLSDDEGIVLVAGNDIGSPPPPPPDGPEVNEGWIDPLEEV